MVNKTERLNVDLNLEKLDEAKKLVKYFEDMNKTTKLIQSNMANIKKTFDTIVRQNIDFQSKFQQSPSVVGKVTSRANPAVQLINAEEKRVRQLSKAYKALELQKLAANKQQFLAGDNLQTAKAKLEAQTRRLNDFVLGGTQPRDSKGRFTSLNKEIQAYNGLQVAVDKLTRSERQRLNNLKLTESIQRSIQTGRARNKSQELLQVGRDHAVARTTGDGGASLFKIQAQLLGNYLIMNKIFQLFNFGSQFVLQLDQAFRQLQAITATTETEMVNLRNELIQVSEQTKFTAVEVAEAATVLGQAGFSTTEIKESIQDVTFLATAVGTDLKTAVDLTTSVLSVFNLRAEETGHVANVLTGAINNSKLTLDKLSLGLQFAGNTAAQAGATFEETVAVLGAMANAGIRSGSTLGTGLRQVIVSLIKPSEKMSKQLTQLGLTMEDIDVKSNGLVNVFQTLTDAGFTTSQAFESMQVRAAAAFLAVSNNLDVARELETSLLLTNAAAEANAVQMQSLANSMDKFRSILGTVIVKFSEPFKDFLIGSIQLLGGMLTALNKLGVVLPVIGSALIGIGSGFVLTRVVKLVDNLFGLSRAGKVAAKSTDLLGRNIGRTTILVRNFQKVLRANALGLAIGAFITFADVFDRFIGGSRSSAESLDTLKASLDEANGVFDTTASRVLSIDETIERLSDRYNILSKDNKALKVEILKAQLTFGDLGVNIDNNANSVEELITSLRELRKELILVQGDNLKAVESSRKVLLQQQLLNLKSGLQSSGREQGSLLTGFTDSNAVSLATDNDLAGVRAVRAQSKGLISKVEELLNQDLDDTDNLVNIQSQVNDLRKDLTTVLRNANEEVRKLRAQKDKSGFFTSISGANIDTAESVRQSIEKNRALLNDFSGGISSLIADAKRIKTNEFQKSFTGLINAGIDSFAIQTAGIKKELSDAGKDQGLRREVAQKYKTELGSIQEQAEGLILKFVDPRILKEIGIEGVLQQSSEQLVRAAKLISERQSLVNNADEAATEYLDGISKLQLETLRNEKKILEEKIKREQTSEGRQNIAAQIRDIINQIFNLEVEEYKRELTSGNLTGLETEAVNKKIKLLEFDKENEVDKVGETLTKLSDKFIDVDKALQKQVDEVAKINRLADQSLRPIENRRARLQSALEGNPDQFVDSSQKRRIQDQLDNLESEALQVRQEVLLKQQNELKELVARREFERTEAEAKARGLGTQESVNKAKESASNLEKARKALSDTSKELTQVEAELQGKTDATAASMVSNTQIITDSINQWGRDLNFDIGEGIRGSLDETKGAFSTFITDVTSGTASAKDAFKSMAVSIIESLQKVVAEFLATQIFRMVLGSFGGFFAGGGSVPQTAGVTSGANGLSESLLKFAAGGSVRRAATGYGNQFRDSVNVLARPGEYVLRNSAVDMIGKENLDQINALGNRKISKGVPTMPMTGKQSSDTVNVYVVSPDQKPSMTPKDVVVAITEDLAKGGPTKKLVKSIQLGKT